MKPIEPNPGEPQASPPRERPGLAQTGHENRTQAPEPKHESAAGLAERPEQEELAKDAYVVSLPSFEGPLDLLLHLIQKHELDILDIPIGFVTTKYLEYLKLMETLTIDVASEYLVMAATLAHIKSKQLLPDAASQGGEDGVEEEEADPRAELVKRLLEYQKYKNAAEQLGARDTLGQAVFGRGGSEEVPDGPAPFAALGVFNLLDAFQKVLSRTNAKIEHEIVFDRISISERIVELTDQLKSRTNVPFEEIFAKGGKVNRFDLVITFLAVLEMCRLRMMRVFQSDALSPIYLDLLVVSEDQDPLDMRPSKPPVAEPLPDDAEGVLEAELPPAEEGESA